MFSYSDKYDKAFRGLKAGGFTNSIITSINKPIHTNIFVNSIQRRVEGNVVPLFNVNRDKWKIETVEEEDDRKEDEEGVNSKKEAVVHPPTKRFILDHNLQNIHPAIRKIYYPDSTAHGASVSETDHVIPPPPPNSNSPEYIKTFLEERRKYAEQFKKHVYTREELRAICEKFKLSFMPNHDKTEKTEEQIEQESLIMRPKAKNWRRDPPTKQERRRLVELIQNTLPWHIGRGWGWGASTKHVLIGADKFAFNNVGQFFEDIGFVVRDVQIDTYPTDHGHFHEEEGCDLVVSIMFHEQTKEIGIIVHKKWPFAQASPDILFKCSATVIFNKHTVFDSKWTMMEVKFPNFNCLKEPRDDEDEMQICTIDEDGNIVNDDNKPSESCKKEKKEKKKKNNKRKNNNTQEDEISHIDKKSKKENIDKNPFDSPIVENKDEKTKRKRKEGLRERSSLKERSFLVEEDCIIDDDKDYIPNTITPNYLVQVQDQCATAEHPFEEFLNFWKFTPRCMWRHIGKSPRQHIYMASELTITRIYHNKEFTDKLYYELNKHRHRVEHKIEPKMLPNCMAMPPCSFVPLFYCKIYISGFPPIDSSQVKHDDKTPFNHYTHLEWFVKTQNIDIPRPSDWKGIWPPYIAIDIVNYFDVAPGTFTIKEDGKVHRDLFVY